MTAQNNVVDPYVPYGIGGAGNMRRQSAIRDAWYKLATTESTGDDVEKQESHNSVAMSRRRSSAWSTGTAGEHRFGWKKLFGRRKSEAEGEGVAKIEE